MVIQGYRFRCWREMECCMNHDYNLKFFVLGSGSKGNSVFISDGTTSILIDAGFTSKEIERRLKSKGIQPDTLDAIVLSHEHTDHVLGAGILSARYQLPIYLSFGTQQAVEPLFRNVYEYRAFETGASFSINTLTIHPFSISHDAEEPNGFTVSYNGTKVGIATDMGMVTHMVRTHLKGCRLLVLEANHDLNMLMDGPYPWHLKQRIKGRTGHLSNDDTRNLLKDIYHDQLKYVVLAHLSETNNTPQMALHTVKSSLIDLQTNIIVADQYYSSEVVYI